jgi:type I restriction enzyme R subunit
LIYLNGFPIIVFELKTPQYNSSILESSSLSNAFQQINNYKKQIPDLFVFNFFNVITNMTITKFGSTFNNLDRFNY